MSEQKAELLFSPEIAEMFSRIVINEDELFKILLLFVKADQQRKAVSIQMIVSEVVVVRRVAVQKGRRHVFEETSTNIAKGAAVRALDQLVKMSLIYSEAVGRTYVYYLTERGKQISKNILQHYQKLKNEESSNNASFKTSD